MSITKKCKQKAIQVCKFFMLQIGRIIARKYECQENSLFFIKHYHLGDHVRTLPAISMLKKYRISQGKTVDKIVVFTKQNYSDLTKMNTDVDNVIVLNKYILMLFNYAVLNRKKPYENIFVDVKGYYTIEQKLDYYKIPKDFITANAEYSFIPNYLNSLSYKKAEYFIKAQGVSYEEIVMIVPNAGSSSSIEY